MKCLVLQTVGHAVAESYFLEQKVDGIDEALFQLMRLNIMKSENFPSAYLYAWESSVYPLLHQSADWHHPFAEQFEVSEAQMSELQKLLFDAKESGAPKSFYEIEDHFDLRGATDGYGPSKNGWDRSKLVCACRYLFLCEGLGLGIFQAMLENGRHPAEASLVMQSLRDDELHFI